MREFFRGWQRKLGCAFLAMACALLIVWMRSQFIIDQRTFKVSSKIHFAVISQSGYFSVSSMDEDQFKFIGDTKVFPIVVLWKIHFLLMAIPLTAASAYLILCARRMQPITESPPDA